MFNYPTFLGHAAKISQCQRIITIPYSQLKSGLIVAMKAENHCDMYYIMPVLLDLPVILYDDFP